ncbi:MAG: hypothetical protein GDA43_11125 [Hormoscilla sp. SP5CHS1]|nr:hypothetical protein [Hormoscilla sp. SP12CHS1]MBC6453688.1 hypothetical protein [Hormoscilla sp. SP5CHS1]
MTSESLSKEEKSRESQPADGGQEAKVSPPVKEKPASLHPAPPRPRPQPISPPSEPKQYRAIGLVRGRYTPMPTQFTQGTLTASDGTTIDAVLLGRIISLLRKHMNLEEEHLWVVYPRTREKEQDLHTQIVGVWDPETLVKNQVIDKTKIADTAHFEDGYFSIRGEVVYSSQEKEEVVVKLHQAPRKKEERPKSFKLKLKGVLTGKVLNHFWEFDVQRQGNDLVIQSGTAIAALASKFKQKNNFSKKKGPGGFKKPKGSPRPPGTDELQSSSDFSGTVPRKPISKPSRSRKQNTPE